MWLVLADYTTLNKAGPRARAGSLATKSRTRRPTSASAAVDGSGTAVSVRLVRLLLLTTPAGGSSVTRALVETPRAEGGVRGQGVARKYRGRGKGVEVGMEGHRPSRQGRKEGGGMDVDINGMHAGESDVNLAARAKVSRIDQS